VSSLRGGGVSIVFHVAHANATEALMLHSKQGKQVRLDVYSEDE
jgi:hypothetical protein